jgi:hypothetical protein
MRLPWFVREQACTIDLLYESTKQGKFIVYQDLRSSNGKTNRKGHKGHVRAASRREVKRLSERFCVSPIYKSTNQITSQAKTFSAMTILLF